MDVDVFAKKLHEIKRKEPRKGRTPAMFKNDWDKLTNAQKDVLRKEVRDVIESLASSGVTINFIRQQPALRTAKKVQGRFL